MDTLKRKHKGDGKDRQPSVSAREKGVSRKTENKLRDPKQHIGDKEAFCFSLSQPIVLFAEGENVNPLWKEELGRICSKYPY